MLSACSKGIVVRVVTSLASIILLLHGAYGIETDEWSQWSVCDVTCGHGVRARYRRRVDENGTSYVKDTRHCFHKFCPSYLGWPRIHFSGQIMADANTVNNIRCSYDNQAFYPADQSKRYFGLGEVHGTHTYYTYSTRDWNPDGTNQFYFIDTNVTSICLGYNRCSSEVKLPVRESTRGVMTEIDVDWQKTTEIWGLEVTIPGILKGAFLPASHEMARLRLTAKSVEKSQRYILRLMGRYKSKLRNVTWYDDYYKTLFGESKDLSMTFDIDHFDIFSYIGRVTGTIGMTSDDDPLQTSRGRVLQTHGDAKSKGLGPAPFYIHEKEKILTVDLSTSFQGLLNGSITTEGFGKLDLAALVPACSQCRTTTWRRITADGHISDIVSKSLEWYLTYGGIVDIDLSHIDASDMKLLGRSRVGIISDTGLVYFMEYPYGLNFGFLDRTVFRLNVGESRLRHIFVSSFGKPVKHAHINIYRIEGVKADTSCPIPSCNRSLGLPSSALGLSSDYKVILTNSSGLATVKVTALSDPGNVRGCGLDGQVYPLKLFVRIRRGHKTWTFSDSWRGSTNSRPYAWHKTENFGIAARIYNTAPQKQCPTWKDVREIFLQYYNLYPVMWKFGIIDLHSYDDIRRKSKMVYEAMFRTDYSDPRYMPMSRDLSEGKRGLIHNWIKCGMPKDGLPVSDNCTDSSLGKGLAEVKGLLQQAIMLELSTIPVYMTAWLSLKTEFGRNTEIADVLKSVFVEEMLHMSLAANILNSIGGSVNLTDERKLPAYPTVLATGTGFQVLPNVEVALSPFSIGLVDQVFSRIEEPADSKTREVINHIGSFWRHMYGNISTSISRNMKTLLNHMGHSLNRSKSDIPVSETLQDLKTLVNNITLEGLRQTSGSIMKHLIENTARSVGGLYSIIALKLINLESCARLIHSKLPNGCDINCTVGSIFNGEVSYQLNMSHWYQKSHDSILELIESNSGSWSSQDVIAEVRRKANKTTKPPLFKVDDLKSALEAIVEIIYQGEGGSECFPLVPKTDIYASSRGRDLGNELSHYYRFREIVKGRKLVKMPHSNMCQSCNQEPRMSSCYTMTQQCFCYAGQLLPFYEDGVWPMISNPKNNDYVKGTKAHRLNTQFNLLYTRLLFCLQNAFHGEPKLMKNCMSLMYDITIAGKQLVQTPISNPKLAQSGLHGTPTWQFVREKWYRAGFPQRN